MGDTMSVMCSSFKGNATGVGKKGLLAVLVVTGLGLKLLHHCLTTKRYRLPPGPTGLPIVGYLPFFGPDPPVHFTQLAQVYGGVFSLSMGSWPAVVVSGLDAIKEALVTRGDDFSGRPAFTSTQLINDGRSLAFSTFDDAWKIHRKIVMNTLHKSTTTMKISMEEIILAECDYIVDDFLSHGESSFSPRRACLLAPSGILYQILYGRHENLRHDLDFIKTLESQEVQEFAKPGNPADVMPWLKIFMRGQLNRLRVYLDEFSLIREKKVHEHEETLSKENLRDLTDILIHAGNTLTTEEKATGIDKRRVVESLDNLLGAGTDTAFSTLHWALQILVIYPDIQEKVFAQIKEVVGLGRRPRFDDRENLPLVEATILEVLRHAAVLAFPTPHSTTKDTTLCGYDIPKDTVVLVNLYSVYVDEALWGDPGTFRPERFLDAGGRLDKGLVEQVPAFSLGRRRCPGDQLARMELFLVLTCLLQRLRFYQPPAHPGYTLQADWDLVRNLRPYQLCVSARE